MLFDCMWVLSLYIRTDGDRQLIECILNVQNDWDVAVANGMTRTMAETSQLENCKRCWGFRLMLWDCIGAVHLLLLGGIKSRLQFGVVWCIWKCARRPSRSKLTTCHMSQYWPHGWNIHWEVRCRNPYVPRAAVAAPDIKSSLFRRFRLWVCWVETSFPLQSIRQAFL